MIVYIYNIGVDLYNGFNGLRHRINWTYFTVLDGLAHPLYSVYKMESFRQDRKADKISLVCMIFVAACVYISGHGSIIGSLCIGAIFAMAVIGLYYLYYDNSTKRIYAFFSLLGLLLFIQFLIFMGMDYRWISYILMLYIIVILNMICR